MEYTRGKWIVVGKKSVAYAGYNIYDETQGTLTKEVAIVYPNPQGKSDYYGEANARLISAAPDLYEACKEMIAVLTLYGSEKPEPEFLRMKQAIAKAGGN